MFISGYAIDEYTHVSNCSTHRFELIISQYDADLKTTDFINSNYHFEVFEDGYVFHVVKFSSGSECQMLRYSHQKRYTSNFHNVCGQCYVFVLLHDGQWN